MENNRQEENAKIHSGLVGIHFAKTEISDIRGDEGKLYYRGYSIDDLVLTPSYERAAFLLVHGDWPTADEHRAFCGELASFRHLPDDVADLVDQLKLARPYAALRTVTSALEEWGGEDRHGDGCDLRLVALIPSIVAAHHAARSGWPRPTPDLTLDLASDFLRQLLGRRPTDLEQRAINLDFVLHAEHGANASTFAARVVASTEASTVGAITAALAALDGPLHGGAPTAVSDLLDQLPSPAAAQKLVADRRAARQPVHGFGHRVYRREDPRARYYREIAEALSQVRNEPRMLIILDAMVEAMAPYRRFGIAVNDDLYAAAVYRLLDLPSDLFTSVFAASRVTGWIAHVIEQRSSNVLIRPRLSYVGHEPRSLPEEARA